MASFAQFYPAKKWLVCSERPTEDLGSQHGTMARYRRGPDANNEPKPCRCEPCRKAWAAYCKQHSPKAVRDRKL